MIFHFLYPFSTPYVSLFFAFKSVIGNDFDKSAKLRSLIVDTEITISGEQNVILKIVRSVKVFSGSVTDFENVQGQRHGGDLSCRPSTELLVIAKMLFYKDTFYFCITMNFSALGWARSGVPKGTQSHIVSLRRTFKR